MASRGEAIASTVAGLLGADNLTAERISAIAKDVKRLAASLDVEARRVKNFKINIHWKSRVINVPRAIQNFRDLIHDLTTGLKEKVLLIEQPFVSFEAGLKLIGKQPLEQGVSPLTRGINEAQQFLLSLNVLVGDLATALQSSLALTALFDRVINDIEHLEDLFLPQNSTRSKTTVTYYKRS